MKRAFSEVGIPHPLQVARDGQVVMDYLSGRGAYADREEFPMPILILLDLKLPGATGLEVLKWMRNQPELKTVITIMFTSSALRPDIETAYQLGANAYLVKPSTPQKLCDVVTRIKQFWLELNQFPVLSQENHSFAHCA